MAHPERTPHVERIERSTQHEARSTPVLLYDGSCGMCSESVQVVLKHDRRGTLRFAALQGEFGMLTIAHHPELRSVDSMIWVEQDESGAERVVIRSTAALRIAAYLGGIWRVALIGYVLPTPVRDGLYNFIARHRHQIMGSRENCLVVTPEIRSRFLP
jgi:predicted DCC family thiol-disulfide oxidoreductase YuxK